MSIGFHTDAETLAIKEKTMKISNKEYRSMEGISRSELWTIISKTPMHFLHEQFNPKEDTPSLLFGRATHKAILEPETFSDEFAVGIRVDRRTKEGKEKWEEFVASVGNREVISPDDMDVLRDMKQAIDDDYLASTFLTGIHEESFFWTDAETGEKCKVRPDCIAEVDGKKYVNHYINYGGALKKDEYLCFMKTYSKYVEIKQFS